MAGKQTRRVVTYLSDEQYEIFNEWTKRNGVSEADVVRWALRAYMERLMRQYWPTNDPERGGKREGAGRPPKNGG